MTAECDAKRAAKFDAASTNEAFNWMKAVLSFRDSDNQEAISGLTKVEKMDDVKDMLKDGKILCKVINVMYPGAVKKINESKMAFKQMENIGFFLTACEEHAKMKKSDLFQTVDLYEASNIPGVISSIYALGRKTNDLPDGFPVLGPKEASANERTFTEEQMNEGKNHIGLQMGSNKGASQAGLNFGKTRAIID